MVHHMADDAGFGQKLRQHSQPPRSPRSLGFLTANRFLRKNVLGANVSNDQELFYDQFPEYYSCHTLLVK